MWNTYSGLTVPPDALVGHVPDHQALPPIPEVDDHRGWTGEGASMDPLVPPVHRSIQLLQAYWHAGWTNAVPITALRCSARDRLFTVAEGLPDGFGLAIFDAWRPLELQAEIFDVVNEDDKLPPGYFAHPRTDPFDPPPHSTGGSVDLTLSYEGAALMLGSAFDEFTPRSHLHAYEECPGIIRSLRRMLFWRMRDQGFVGIRTEWWHFEFGTVRWAARTGEEPIFGRMDLAC
jgi:D-alanyl-D-alanine dipeptidase